MRAIADHIQSTLSASGIYPLGTEGFSSSQWVLLDFGDVVVHVFRADVREHYGLERLWADAKRVRLPSQRAAAPVGALTTTAGRVARARERHS